MGQLHAPVIFRGGYDVNYMAESMLEPSHSKAVIHVFVVAERKQNKKNEVSSL